MSTATFPGRATSPPGAPGSTALPRSAPSSLGGLDKWQASSIDALRDPNSPHAAMLSTLIVTNCLLELAKLGSMRLAIAEFVQSSVACLTQYAPIDRCAITVEAPGLPHTRVESGEWPEPSDGPVAVDLSLAVEPLSSFGAEPLSGKIEVGGLPELLQEAGLVTRVAEQLSLVLPAVVEAERARREAALTKVLDLVSSISETYGDEAIQELVGAFQMLPGAVGASMLVQAKRFGGPIEATAGQTSASLDVSEWTDELDRSSTLTTRLWWADATDSAREKAKELHERLVTVLRRIEQTIRLLEESESDELTGIGNRRLASKVLAQTSARAKRIGEEFAVLILDLDKFKSVNDRFGHDVGDCVLAAFAGMLKATVREYDVPVRWGGEEFLIIAPATDGDGAAALAHRLLRGTPGSCEGILPEGEQTVSIGVAVFPQHGVNPMDLVKAADGALYSAKNSGRNRFQLAVAAAGK